MVRAKPSGFGVDIVGDIAWGTHLCQFYQTKEDLADILVPYFAEGLRRNEFCMWVTSPSLEVEEAKKALGKAVPSLDQYIKDGQIEVISYVDWYLRGGEFDADRVLNGWVGKEKAALSRGFEGLRLTGNTFWVERAQWSSFVDYEAKINAVIGQHRIIALCTYSLKKCSGEDVVDVIKNHAGSLVRKDKVWNLVEDVTERKMAEEALDKERQELRGIIESTDAMIAYLDLGFNFIHVNAAYADGSGYPINELIGKNHFALFPSEENQAIFEKVRDTGQPIKFLDKPFEYANQPQRGITHWDWTLAPVKDEKGKVQGLILTLIETTERKKAEDDLRNSFERFKLLSDATSQLLATDKPQTIVEDICTSVMNHLRCDCFFNFLVDESKGKLRLNTYSGISEQEAEKIEWLGFGVAVCGSVAKCGERIVAEDIQNAPDSRTELVKSYGIQAYACHPLTAQGHIIGTLSFGTRSRSSFAPDELELMRTIANQVATAMQRIIGEKALQESKSKTEEYSEYLENLLNYASAPIICWDSDFKITRFNHAFERLIGYRADGVLGMNLSVLFPAESISESLEKIRRTLTGERWESVEIPIRCRDSETRIVLWNSANIYDKDGKTLIATIAQGQDITERIKTQAKLEDLTAQLEEYANNLEALANERLEKLKDAERLAAIGATAGMVGHDLRNPLQAINGAIYLAMDELVSLPETAEKQTVKEMLEMIEEQAQYMNKIVSDLQSFVKPVKPQLEEADTQKILDDALSLAKIPENVELKTLIRKDVQRITVDPMLIMRVLNNLITNAVQAMPNGGKLTITAQSKDDATLLSVEDTGTGIPEEVKPKLFTPLFTTKSKGQGFGLAVCKRVVEAHGGEITFESAVGKGTTFTLRIPSAK